MGELFGAWADLGGVVLGLGGGGLGIGCGGFWGVGFGFGEGQFGFLAWCVGRLDSVGCVEALGVRFGVWGGGVVWGLGV